MATQLTQLETIEQKVSKLNKEGAETLEALLTNKTLTAAAQELDVSRNAVYGRITKYGLEELISGLKTQAIMALTISGVDAAENLTAKLNSKYDTVSLDASREILDRLGVVKPQKEGGFSLTFNNVAQNQRNDYQLS